MCLMFNNNNNSSSDTTCVDWDNEFFVNISGHKINRFYTHPEHRCMSCPSDCPLGDDIDNNNERCKSCDTMNSDGSCTFGVYNLTYTTILNRANTEHIWGDFIDSATSPNDPMFFFHHINMDRYSYMWQLYNYINEPYYNYPLYGWETGINLNDIASPERPFIGIFNEYPNNKELTYKDIFDSTSFINAEYAYDDLIDALVTNLKLNEEKIKLKNENIQNIKDIKDNQMNINGNIGDISNVASTNGIIGILIFIILGLSGFGMYVYRLIQFSKHNNKLTQADRYIIG